MANSGERLGKKEALESRVEQREEIATRHGLCHCKVPISLNTNLKFRKPSSLNEFQHWG